MMQGFSHVGPVSNSEPWVFATLATGDGDTLQDLSGCAFALEIKDDEGETRLKATTENNKFFVVPHASVIGWIFSADEMGRLSAGTYSAVCEITKDGDTKPIDLDLLATLEIED